MPYFQNPMGAEFRQGWPIDPTALFVIGANTGNIGEMMSVPGPYDLSGGNNVLTVMAAFDRPLSPPRRQFLTFAINVIGINPAATTAQEIVDALNADPGFNGYFYAVLANWPGNGDAPPFLAGGSPYAVQIWPGTSCTNTAQNVTWFIANCGAESALKFNRFAQIVQLPTYFERDTVANRYIYTDGAAMLVQLDPTVPCQAQLIINAGEAFSGGFTNGSPIVTTVDTSPYNMGDNVVLFDGTITVSGTIIAITPNTSITISANWTGATESGYVIDVLADWELLSGRSNHETFDKLTYDGSSRLTSVVTYFSGSKPGDMAVKMQYTYTGANTQPDQITQVPYTLTAADMVIPPP